MENDIGQSDGCGCSSLDQHGKKEAKGETEKSTRRMQWVRDGWGKKGRQRRKADTLPHTHACHAPSHPDPVEIQPWVQVQRHQRLELLDGGHARQAHAETPGLLRLQGDAVQTHVQRVPGGTGVRAQLPKKLRDHRSACGRV